MSRVGLDWYKREPLAYLGDVQGLGARDHAVYSIVLDLLYVHGGAIRNDPKWISGWISDMGAAAVRKSLARLDANPSITITITEGEISQKRAKSEVKTKRIQNESAAISGKKGGKKSAEKRHANNKTNGLEEAPASTATQAEKRREELEEESYDSSLSSDDDATESEVPDEDPFELKPEPVNEVAEAVAIYNEAAGQSGWPKVQVLSKERRSALSARLRESGGIKGWRAAIAKAQASSHCCGQNDRGWVANFDFLTRKSSFTKLMEGNYDDRGPQGRASTAGYAGAETRRDPALEQIARLAGIGAAPGNAGG